MKVLRSVFLCASVMGLAGCGAGLVPSDKYASVGNGISVMPQRPWNRMSSDPEVWTTQGPQIDMVRFFSGVRSGRALISGVSDDRLDFDAKMLPNDVQDLIVATLQREGNKSVRGDNLAPCDFGSGKGFCFDLSFSSASDLEMKGLVMARNQNDRLDVILFQAPAEYYFGEMSPDVRKALASIQVK